MLTPSTTSARRRTPTSSLFASTALFYPPTSTLIPYTPLSKSKSVARPPERYHPPAFVQASARPSPTNGRTCDERPATDEAGSLDSCDEAVGEVDAAPVAQANTLMQATPPTDARVSVHLHSPQKEVPPHPGAGWTRFVCISDTHSGIFRLPHGDVLLHAGDLSSYGALPQLTRTVDWLKSLKHPVKIMIAGNHDLCLDENWARPDYGFQPELIQYARTTVRSLASAGLYYLEHEPLNFTAPSGRVWKVYGSPAVPIHLDGAFQYASSTEAKAIYQRIPEDTEILITHTPPYRTLDKTRKGKHVGCQVLASRLKKLAHCRLHVFGHIHEDAGARVDGVEGMHRVSVNAAVPLSDSIVVVDMRD